MCGCCVLATDAITTHEAIGGGGGAVVITTNNTRRGDGNSTATTSIHGPAPSKDDWKKEHTHGTHTMDRGVRAIVSSNAEFIYRILEYYKVAFQIVYAKPEKILLLLY